MNKAQYAIALADYAADSRGDGFAAMQAAVNAAPAHHYLSAPPKLNDLGQPINRKDAAKWSDLTNTEQQQRIDDAATRKAVLDTQGALWVVAMNKDVALAGLTTITSEQLYEEVDDAEEDALNARPLQALQSLYTLPSIDISPNSKGRTQLGRIFPDAAGPTRVNLDNYIAERTQKVHQSLGLPVPTMGIFQSLSKQAG